MLAVGSDTEAQSQWAGREGHEAGIQGHEKFRGVKVASGLHGKCVFFFQAEDGIRDYKVTGVQTCALPIFCRRARKQHPMRRFVARSARYFPKRLRAGSSPASSV